MEKSEFHVVPYVAKQAVIGEPFIKLEESDIEPGREYLYYLFTVDMKSHEYTKSVALDIRNGRPYFLNDECRSVSFIITSELFVTPINYDKVRELASKKGFDEDYAQLNENTWRDYIPKDVFKRFNEKIQKKMASAPIIEAVDGNSLKDTLFEFCYEFHNGHSHHITYLRKTTEGYRIFHVSSLGWTYGLPFHFDETEVMIQDIICNQKFGYKFDAYDRLLSESEVQYIQAKANEQDSKKSAFMPECSSCYQVWQNRKTTECTKKWEQFDSLLKKIAKYGTTTASYAGNCDDYETLLKNIAKYGTTSRLKEKNEEKINEEKIYNLQTGKKPNLIILVGFCMVICGLVFRGVLESYSTVGIRILLSSLFVVAGLLTLVKGIKDRFDTKGDREFEANQSEVTPPKSNTFVCDVCGKELPIKYRHSESVCAECHAVKPASKSNSTEGKDKAVFHLGTFNFSDEERQKMKTVALRYLPTTLDTVESQLSLLKTLSPVMDITVVELKTEFLWKMHDSMPDEIKKSRFTSALIETISAINQTLCFLNPDFLITKVDRANVEELLKAWIVLDYYAHVLKPVEHTTNIQHFRDYIHNVIHMKFF